MIPLCVNIVSSYGLGYSIVFVSHENVDDGMEDLPPILHVDIPVGPYTR